jgi:hypothetical protein
MIPSPRSVTTRPPSPADDMDVSDDECPIPEMPSFLPALLIECLGYPAGLGAMVACQSWRQQAERIFRAELAELRTANDCVAEYLDLPKSTKSTISVAFSADHRRFASTHGDHTVKVVDFDSKEVVSTLVGHPRTPWTVKFHPTDPDIVASGCLGFEARVWNCTTQICLRKAEFNRAIISLSFHPSGDILAVAAGTAIYLWDYSSGAPPIREFVHEHPIRCLRFLPSRDALIVGAANSTRGEEDDRLTFQLMLCAFDVNAAREDASSHSTRARLTSSPTSSLENEPPLVAREQGGGRAIGAHPRKVLKRALFYNDGGFDVSPCGRFLVSCAELYVPGAAVSTETPPAEEANEPPPPPPLRLHPSTPSMPLPSFVSRSPATPGSNSSFFGRIFASPQPSTPPRPWSVTSTQTPPPPPAPVQEGRYRPHLVVVSLTEETDDGEGRLLQAAPLDSQSFSTNTTEAGGSDIVTSVKLSPTASLVLLGHSRGGDGTSSDSAPRVVSVTYRVGDMARVDVREEVGDDVNIARFHPTPGRGLIYGTKQGKLCRMTPRPPTPPPASGGP